MRKTTLAVTVLALPLLTACGTSKEDRTLGGAALGAGLGTGLGVALGPIGIVSGAALGAVAGSTAGAFTTPEQVDYGVPIWRQDLFENMRGTSD